VTTQQLTVADLLTYLQAVQAAYGADLPVWLAVQDQTGADLVRPLLEVTTQGDAEAYAAVLLLGPGEADGGKATRWH
jgi:hypothetical protein